MTRELLVECIKKEVGPGNRCVTSIEMNNLLKLSQFEQIWSILVPKENRDGLKELRFIGMPLNVEVPVISVLINSNIFHLLTCL